MLAEQRQIEKTIKIKPLIEFCKHKYVDTIRTKIIKIFNPIDFYWKIFFFISFYDGKSYKNTSDAFRITIWQLLIYRLFLNILRKLDTM